MAKQLKSEKMKLLTSLSILLLSSISFAGGVTGSGTPPRPSMSSLRIGGGLIPGFQDPAKVDFVKSLGLNQEGNIKFNYKGFDSTKVETHELNPSDFDQRFFEALKKSAASGKWEPVKIEENINN